MENLYGNHANHYIPDEESKASFNHPYFAQCGLSYEVLKDFGVSYSQNGSFAGRVLVPIRNYRGIISGYAARWPGEPPEDRPVYIFNKGYVIGSDVFNLDRIKGLFPKGPLVISEDLFMVMKLWQMGFHHAISLMRYSISDQQMKLLLESSIDQFNVILVYKNDDIGMAACENIYSQLSFYNFVRVFYLTPQCQDHHNELESLLCSIKP